MRRAGESGRMIENALGGDKEKCVCHSKWPFGTDWHPKRGLNSLPWNFESLQKTLDLQVELSRQNQYE